MTTALAPMLQPVARPSALPSRYVRRCAGPCGQVRGNSQFRVLARRERASVCRFCEERNAEREKQLKADARAVALLRVKEERLVEALRQVRRQISVAEFRLAERTQGQLDLDDHSPAASLSGARTPNELRDDVR